MREELERGLELRERGRGEQGRLPRPRPARRAVLRLRDADRPRRLRGAHDLLLPDLPDRGPAPQGPPALAAAALRIALVRWRRMSGVARIDEAAPGILARDRASPSRAPASAASRRRSGSGAGTPRRSWPRRSTARSTSPPTRRASTCRASPSSSRRRSTSWSAREALLVEVLAEHIASRSSSDSERCAPRCRSSRSGRSARTPVTGLATQEMVTLWRHRRARPRAGSRRVVGVEATGINACPCAQGLVRDQRERAAARGRLRGRRRRAHPRARPARDAQPARPRRRCSSARSRTSTRSSSSSVAERSMSAPIYDLLKRPDELFVVEHAHLAAALRRGLGAARAARRDRGLPDLDDADFLLSRQVELRDHPHARRRRRAFGTVGELRAELATGQPGRQTSLADWLSGVAAAATLRRGAARRRSKRCSVPASSRRMFARWRDDDRAPLAAMREHDHRPRVADEPGEDRERDRRSSDRRERRVARREEDREPDRDGRQARRAERAEDRPAGGRDHLPALLEAQEERPRSGRASPPRRRAPPRGRRPRASAEQRRHEALRARRAARPATPSLRP